jgi:hypothetical protein
MKDKSQFNVTLEKHQFAFLSEMAKKYKLPDESKALRCLITFAIEQPDQQPVIFDEIRCQDC